MELLTNKKFVQKMIIALVFVILFNFVSPQISFGAADDFAGPLFEPIKALTLFIGDSAVNIMQSIIFGTDLSLLKLEHSTSIISTILSAGGGILAGAAVIAAWVAVPFTAGLSIGVLAAAVGTGIVAGHKVGKITSKMIPQTFYLPLYNISPEEIFSNKIALLDVNFFNPGESSSFSSGNIMQSGKEQVSTAKQLQGTIAKWYITIRNFSIVALLSILVYIGIRIIISSNAQDKAKYKQRLFDWLIAMCMLFFLHYIMAFAVTVTELITSSLTNINYDYMEIIGTDEALDGYKWNFQVTKDDGETVKVEDRIWDDKSEFFQILKDSGYIIDGRVNDDGSSSDDGYTLIWPLNLMGKARIEASLKVDGEDGNQTLMRQFGYTIIFVALVMYTVLFLFRYLKRLLMLAFLTIIAPFVAVTYPLDKMGDGSAQAFNMWLKEYIYNLLIQPVHLVLYTILIGTSIEFAANNLIYALVALGFMLPAEKIMRKFFGFEKASTVAGGSALGGAMAMQAINSLRKIGGPKKSKGGAGGKGENSNVDGNNKIKMADRKADDGKDIGDLLEVGDSEEKPGSLPTPGLDNPLDKTSEEGNKIKDAKAMHEAGMIDDESLLNAKEKDTRGIGQWISDAYQGSGLQSGIHNKINEWNDKIYNSKEGEAYRYLKYQAGKKIKKIPKPIRNTIRGVTSVADKGLAQTGKIAIKSIPKIGNAAIKGTVAGTAAMGGIAAGLVSEDYGNVLKWGAAGAGAGMIGADGAISMGNSLGQGISNSLESAANTYTIAAHGYDGAEKIQNEKADKAAMKDKDRQAKYAEKLKLQNKAAIQEAMKQAQTYRESGITDDDLIIKAMKAKTFKSERDSRERIITAGLAEKANNNGQDIKENLEYIKGQLSERGISDADINKYITGIKEINKWKI